MASIMETMFIYLAREAQIAALQIDKTSTKVPAEYLDYANIFFSDLAIELPENISINEYAIKLINRKQLLYRLIYTLNPVELKILKAYIKTHLKTGIIKLFKSPTVTLILFNKKPDGSFCLCIDYRSLNNLTIKNWYFFPLIGESFDRLGQSKRFTQLDLTSAYHQIRI